MSELGELTRESLEIDPQKWSSDIEEFISTKFVESKKNGIVVTISGGLDSRVTANLLVRAIGITARVVRGSSAKKYSRSFDFLGFTIEPHWVSIKAGCRLLPRSVSAKSRLVVCWVKLPWVTRLAASRFKKRHTTFHQYKKS